MLVLTRRANESIVIGHDVVVTVLEVRGEQVRIGIDAPREVTIHRQEIWEQVRDENRAAAASPADIAARLPKSGSGGSRAKGSRP